MRPGVRLGLDVGQVRTGVAYCDPAGSLASALTTLQMGNENDFHREVEDLVKQYDVIEVIVGIPTSLSGKLTAAAQQVRQRAYHLAVHLAPIPVRVHDERFTTVQAHRTLADQGRRAKERKAVVDSLAATLILQSALDYERNADRPPGRLVRTKTNEEGPS